jgi:drug/metabolite transporter (DMT)-like permease
MSETSKSDDAVGPRHLLGSLILFLVGGLLLVNLHEDETIFGIGAILCLVPAVYLLIVGAVARGIQAARPR